MEYFNTEESQNRQYLVINRLKSQLIPREEQKAQVAEPPRRNIFGFPVRPRRIEDIPFDRYSIICFCYLQHYVFFSIIIYIMYKLGCFDKLNGNDYYALESKDHFANVDCSPVMENWFATWIFFQPFAILVSIWSACLSKNRYDAKQYILETWYRRFIVYSNNESIINYPIIFLDVFNLVWAVTGNIISKVYANEKAYITSSALRDC